MNAPITAYLWFLAFVVIVAVVLTLMAAWEALGNWSERHVQAHVDAAMMDRPGTFEALVDEVAESDYDAAANEAAYNRLGKEGNR
jgi:hypothetical protein